MPNLLGNGEVPVGFGMALAENLDAMRGFAALSEAEQSSVLARARTVNSRDEMHALVRSLAR